MWARTALDHSAVFNSLNAAKAFLSGFFRFKHRCIIVKLKSVSDCDRFQVVLSCFTTGSELRMCEMGELGCICHPAQHGLAEFVRTWMVWEYGELFRNRGNARADTFTRPLYSIYVELLVRRSTSFQIPPLPPLFFTAVCVSQALQLCRLHK